MREEKYANLDVSELDPMLVALCDIAPMDMRDVFEQLNITVDCCRTRLTTQVEFKELY
jgi:DNA-directed RNA polymerase subunit N (RpoN/RPB10)